MFRLEGSGRYENIKVEESLKILNFNFGLNFNVDKFKSIVVTFSIVDITLPT